MGEIEAVDEKSLKLEKRTKEIKDFCFKVETILKKSVINEVITEIQGDVPDLVPIRGEADPIERLHALFDSIAEITKEASNQDFDTVINPCSGSDITTGLAYEPNHLVTIDDGDLFAIYDDTEAVLQEKLKTMLRKKLIMGMHVFGGNGGLAAYAMELVLNEVDLNSIKVVEEESITTEQRKSATLTKVRFINNGKTVEHTNFGGVYLSDHFNNDRLVDIFLKNKLVSIVSESDKLVLISKAAGGSMVGSNIATSSFYPLMPEGAVVVSDVNEESSVKGVVRLENLKTNVVAQKLSDVQGGKAPEISSYNNNTKYLVYGYSSDLTDLGIYRVRR